MKKRFAFGGLTEHGLRVGDTIIEQLNDDLIKVFNPSTGIRLVNLGLGLSQQEDFQEDTSIPHSYADFQKDLAVLFYRLTEAEKNIDGVYGFDEYEHILQLKNEYIEKVKNAWLKIANDAESDNNMDRYYKYLNMYKKLTSVVNTTYARGGVSHSRKLRSSRISSSKYRNMRKR